MAMGPISITSASVAATGLLALYALHHLRAQPRRQKVATLIFWQKTVRQQKSSVPWSRRFTHWRTFALLATIIVLLSATLSASNWLDRRANHRQDVVVIDSGEATAAADGTGQTLLQRLLDAVRADLDRLPEGTAVIAAGPVPLMWIAPGEPSALVDPTLRTMLPSPGASASRSALLMAGGIAGNASGKIHWYTDRIAIPPGLPDEIARRIVVHSVAPPSAVAIAGATFASAGDDLTGTLHVNLAGAPTAGMTLETSDRQGLSISVPAVMPSDHATVDLPGLPADGRVVRIALTNAPGPAATHAIDFHLPDRRSVRFQFASGVPTALRQALSAIGIDAADGGQVFVGPYGAAVPSTAVAAIRVISDGTAITGGAALSFPAALTMGRGLDLEAATCAKGPALTVGSTPVLMAGQQVVASIDIATALPALFLSEGLIDDDANLPRHAVFPVLLDRLCDALTHRLLPSAVITAERAAQDPLWVGPRDAPDMNILQAAELPATLDVPERRSSPLIDDPGRRTPWTEIILAAALAVMVVESLLWAARKIA